MPALGDGDSDADSGVAAWTQAHSDALDRLALAIGLAKDVLDQSECLCAAGLRRFRLENEISGRGVQHSRTALLG